MVFAESAAEVSFGSVDSTVGFNSCSEVSFTCGSRSATASSAALITASASSAVPTASGLMTKEACASSKPMAAFAGCVASSLNAATAERMASSKPVPLYVATSLAVSSWPFCSSNGHAHGFMSDSMSWTTLPSSMDRPASLAVSLSEKPWPSMDKA